MSDNNGLISALVLDGNGGGSQLDADGLNSWHPADGSLWVHLDYTGHLANDWLLNRSGLDPGMVEALTTEEPRPRSLVHKGGMLVILRGVNLNPGKDPEDMVSVRIWIDADRIVTLRRRRVMATDDIHQVLAEGDGPVGPGEFLVALADSLVQRMGGVISDIDDSVDALEDEVIAAQSYELRQKLANIRRAAISMRRHLAPQRDVMARLYNEKVEWLSESERMRLREIADRTTRYVEDLDAIRDRATVTQEELNGRLAEQMNKTMYILSIVAAIFLPLSLLTGLFGINVGGIPGEENSWAFVFFCILLLIIAAGQLWLFKRNKWM